MSRILIPVAALMLAGAAAPGEAGELRVAQSIAPPTRIPAPPRAETIPGTPVATSEIPREVRRAVVADAARRFRVDTNSVMLVQGERVTWPDGALGCPEPGMSYTLAQVSGFRVAAKTLAGALLYHTDSRSHVVICAR